VRKQHSKAKSSKRSSSRLSLTLIAAIVILAIAAVTVVSRQKLSSEGGKPVAHSAHSDSHIDPQPGQTQQLTPDRAEKLAGGLKEIINQNTDLVEVQHADGSVSVNLEDHFQNVTVARVNQNGSLSQSCVDNPQAAGAFFGIDPKLIDNKARARVAPLGKED
jgi:hypothetical protein